MPQLICRRILLKLSGEALMGSQDYGIEQDYLGRLAREIRSLVVAGAQIGLVVGAGNIFRGAGLAEGGIDRVTADQMGMLATVVNALAVQDALKRLKVPVRVMSAFAMESVCEPYARERAVRHLEQGRVVVFGAGTGNPFFTTDSAASLRAIEIDADVLIKATKVDGVYSADPVTDPQAVFYPRLTYDRVLRENLAVMDATAIVMCRDHGMPLRVMNINQPGALMRLMQGDDVGSLVDKGEKS